MKQPASVALLRRLGYAALALAFLQVVWGAIVRITGSGMGCGDYWPTCQGYLFPPLERMDLVLEVTHRYIALGLGLVLLALLGTSVARRREPGVGGAGGVLRAAAIAVAIYVSVALLGAWTVRLGTHPLLNVVHLTLAMALLAATVLIILRAGGLGAGRAALGGGSPKTYRAARAAAVLTFLILVMGALTANIPGAAEACLGFPLCRTGFGDASPHVQLTHRVLAFLLAAHVLGLVIATTRRHEPRLIVNGARGVMALIVVQILIASALVEMTLPWQLQSLHQAVGTLVWIAVFTFTILAGRASRADTISTVGGAGPGGTPSASDSYLTTDQPIAAPRASPR